MESIVKCFFIGNQNIILFPKLKKNDWKATISALTRGISAVSD
jgi:hypothetical protein